MIICLCKTNPLSSFSHFPNNAIVKNSYKKTWVLPILLIGDISTQSPSTRETKHLGQSLGSVALVGLDGLAVDELLVRVGRVDDLLLVRDGQSREAVALAELAAPAGADGVDAAGHAVVRGAAGGLAVDVVRALLHGGAVVAVDAERDMAGGVALVAVAGEVGDGPLRGDGRHELGLEVVDGSGDDGGGSGESAEEEGGELHFDGGVVGFGFWWEVVGSRLMLFDEMMSCDDD